MTAVTALLVGFISEAWSALAGALVIFVLIGFLVHTLRSVTATVIGSHTGWAAAFSSGAGLIFVLLFGFLGVPALANAIEVSSGVSAGCGPLANLGGAAAQLLGAIAALRMLWSMVRSAAGMAVGGASDVAGALFEAGEAVFGMLIAVVSGPLAAYFLGVCG